MPDQTPCFPLPPCLNTSLMPRPYRPHPAVLLHDGWTAASRGEPLDLSQPSAWREGWSFWHQQHPTLDAQITACVRELRAMAREMALPPVQPRF